MNGLDLLVLGLLVLVLTLIALKFIAPPCSTAIEGFQNTSSNTMKCPRGTKSFTNSDGNIQCCRGEVTGNRCEGQVACKISASADNIPFCKAGFQKKWDGEIPEFIKSAVKNNDRQELVMKLLNSSRQFMAELLPFVQKKKITQQEYNQYVNFVRKETDWYKQFAKDIDQGYISSKEEMDEILEDELTFIYNTFMPMYTNFLVKIHSS
jgi:hypothetical protein